jgi:uncharacterized protein (DUF1684 family)
VTVRAIGKAAYAREWADWHRQHEEKLASRNGWLTITGLHWLSQEPQRIDGAPGEWRAGPDGVTVVLPAAGQEASQEEDLVVDGRPVHGEYTFAPIPERGGINAVWGDAVIEVARRGGEYIVRPRHPGNPLRAAFRGVPAYEPDPSWVLEGRYTPFAEPEPVTVGAVVDRIKHTYDAVGRIDFEAGGQQLSLTAFPGHAPGQVSVLFTDATSGRTTYPACRSLTVAVTPGQPSVTLDFNRAVNLPCAYTDFATCPLPPAGNRLPVAVEAGEQTPYERAAI